MKLFKNKNIINYERGLQDVFFLIGIVILLSILVIGLLPAKHSGNVVIQDMFIYVIMVIPAITAIYFIIASFRRNLYVDPSRISNSIRKKITVALLFVAILPSIPIVLASNYLINQNLSSIFFDNISESLNEAVYMSNETVHDLSKSLASEIKEISYFINKFRISPDTSEGRKAIYDICAIKNISIIIYRQTRGNGKNDLQQVSNDFEGISDQVKLFYQYKQVTDTGKIDRLSISNAQYLSGSLSYKKHVLVFFTKIPLVVYSRINLFSESFQDYRQLKRLGSYLRNNTSLFFLILSLFLIVISVFVSIYLSKGLTRPVLELSEAANQVASGDFRIRMKRDSDDELGLLFRSFNQMVIDLNENRKLMYQKQRLEAWREMARRLVHEIKNPLTPIRLSAERMRKRFMEKHPEIEKIIISGTETIIEEVVVLMNILSEFTKFARLPELNRVSEDINPLLDSCISFFSSNEQISFHLDLDPATPSLLLDKVLIRQAMTNLLQNAVDAIGDKGNIELSSKYYATSDPGFVRITLKDDGIGIKDEEVEHIFEPGFSKKTSGTGLGLAIVEKIIIEHNGKIECRSKYGEGTVFNIDLFLDR